MPSELRSQIEVKSGSEKSFGLIFCIVFLLIGFYPLLVEGEGVRLWAVSIGLVFVALAYLSPQILSAPNKLWFKLGVVLGAVVSPVVMVFVYFTTVVPVGLVMRLIGKDLLREKLDKNARSYWIGRSQTASSMRDQF